MVDLEQLQLASERRLNEATREIDQYALSLNGSGTPQAYATIQRRLESASVPVFMLLNMANAEVRQVDMQTDSQRQQFGRVAAKQAIAFSQERLALLRNHAMVDLLVHTSQYVSNIFCPTGEGGGVDPTCTKEGPDTGDGGGGSTNYQQSLSGEYWLQDGQAMFADGDIGDMNHEGYAIDRAQRDVLDAMGAPGEFSNDSYVDWDGFLGWLEDEYGEDEGDQEAAVIESGISEELWEVARGIGNTDARAYAAEHWGWIRVLGNNVQMLDESQLRELADGLYDAHQDEVENQSFNIETKANYYTEVPWPVISDGKATDLREYKSHGTKGWGGNVQNVFCPNGPGGGVDPTCTKDDLGKYSRSKIPAFDPSGTYPLYHVTSDVNLKHILQNGIGTLDMATYNPATGEAQLKKDGYVSWTRDPAYKINGGNVTLVIKDKQKLVEKGIIPEHAVAMLAADATGDILVPGTHEQEEITPGIISSDWIDEIHIPQSLHDEWTELIPRYEGFIQEYKEKITSLDPADPKYARKVEREQRGIISYQKSIEQLKALLNEPRLRVGGYVRRNWDSGEVRIVNAWCPTGEGGGKDNSCSPANKGDGAWDPEVHSSGNAEEDLEYAESPEQVQAILDHYGFDLIGQNSSIADYLPEGLFQDSEGNLVEWDSDSTDTSYTPNSELSQWIYGQDFTELEAYIEEQFQKDFWSAGNMPVYHATPSANIESIQRDGIGADSQTRGMSNRSVGDAVYTTAEYEEALAGSYGDAVFEVNVSEMQRDGFTPDVSLEPDVTAGEAYSAVASVLGIDDFNYDYEAGMSPNTIVFHGNIPAKYVKLLE